MDHFFMVFVNFFFFFEARKLWSTFLSGKKWLLSFSFSLGNNFLHISCCIVRAELSFALNCTKNEEDLQILGRLTQLSAGQMQSLKWEV